MNLRTGEARRDAEIKDLVPYRIAFNNDYVIVNEADKSENIILKMSRHKKLTTVGGVRDIDVFGVKPEREDCRLARNDRFHLITNDQWIWVDIDEFV